MNPDVGMMFNSHSTTLMTNDPRSLTSSTMIGRSREAIVNQGGVVASNFASPTVCSSAPVPTFPVAPGAEHSAQKLQQHQLSTTAYGGGSPLPMEQHRRIVMDYEADFPCLEPSVAPTMFASSAPAVQRSTVTQVFQLPYDERRYRHASDVGERTSEQITCNEIMKKTGTTIELCHNRDQSLTIVVSGKRVATEEARRLIVSALQTQANREVQICKQYHRALIGKEGRRLQELEKETDCKIMVPSRESPSEMIKVIGPREGIERAVHKIQLFADEQSKMASEHLVVPKIYYPWIRGAENKTVEKIMHDTGARVNIPPPSANNELITVTGERDAVKAAVAIIRDIYERMESKAQVVKVKIACNQHRYVVGPYRSGLAEVLRETDVSVEVPDDGSEFITLRGDPENFKRAIPLVYGKALSVVTAQLPCPGWLHKFIIGPKGSGVKAFTEEYTKLRVSFEEDDLIVLEGPPEEVNHAKQALILRVAELQAEMANDIVHVHPSLHGHIVGKNGLNIVRLRQDFEVNVIMPEPNSCSSEIRLEGKREGVMKAKREILALAERKENEKVREILIENRFHRLMIGVKGERARELRQRFPDVVVTFPEPGRKSDSVSLRGPKDEVDKCYKALQEIYHDLLEKNHQVQVPIFKDFLKHIIGKEGYRIKKLIDETHTRIDMPSAGLHGSSPSKPSAGNEQDILLVTGRKADVAKAEKLLQSMQSELASVVTLEVDIPHSIHRSLIGLGGRWVHSIVEECGGVQIKFPPASNKASNVVVIRGPKELAEKAKRLLSDLAKDRELSSCTAEVKARPELFGFLIGSGGSRIKRIREANPGVRILIPTVRDDDRDTIHVVGKQEDVNRVKEQLEEWIKELNQSVEISMNIDPKWHSHFWARSRAVLREIQSECGDVFISFPKAGSKASKVTIKGAKECVEAAHAKMLQCVADWEAQVTQGLHIDPKHYRLLLRNRGARIQEIRADCKVAIKFPDREPPPSSDMTNGVDHEAPPNDLVLITGLPDNVAKAKQMLLDEVPISQVVNVPFEFHRTLIGKQGSEIRKFMDEFNVTVHLPPLEEHSDELRVVGSQSCVQAAVKGIDSRLERFKEEAKDKQLRSFVVQVAVPVVLLPKLIGPKGQEIQKLRTAHDVLISIPRQNEGDSNCNVSITGYEKNALECKADVERMVENYNSLVTQVITLDCRVHSRLIGQRGKNIRKIMDNYKVDIRFPRAGDADPNAVTVTGHSEDAVWDCVDHLRNVEEEFLQDIVERMAYSDPQRSKDKPSSPHGGQGTIVEIVNAPWQRGGDDLEVPDMANLREFPSMGNENGSAPNSNAGVEMEVSESLSTDDEVANRDARIERSIRSVIGRVVVKTEENVPVASSIFDISPLLATGSYGAAERSYVPQTFVQSSGGYENVHQSESNLYTAREMSVYLTSSLPLPSMSSSFASIGGSSFVQDGEVITRSAEHNNGGSILLVSSSSASANDMAYAIPVASSYNESAQTSGVFQPVSQLASANSSDGFGPANSLFSFESNNADWLSAPVAIGEGNAMDAERPSPAGAVCVESNSIFSPSTQENAKPILVTLVAAKPLNNGFDANASTTPGSNNAVALCETWNGNALANFQAKPAINRMDKSSPGPLQKQKRKLPGKTSVSPADGHAVEEPNNEPSSLLGVVKLNKNDVYINTKELSERISYEMRNTNVSQTAFASRILGRSQGTLSDLLRNPKPWNALKSGRETYLRMYNWLQLPREQRMKFFENFDNNQGSSFSSANNGTSTATSSAPSLSAVLSPNEAASGDIGEPLPCAQEDKENESLKKRRKRFKFVSWQKVALESLFTVVERPDRTVQALIAQKLSIDMSTVQNYFMNARRRRTPSRKQDIGPVQNQVVRAVSPPPPGACVSPIALGVRRTGQSTVNSSDRSISELLTPILEAIARSTSSGNQSAAN